MNIEDTANLEILNRKLILVRDNVRSVAMKYNHGFFLYGAGGTGKSFTVTTELENLGTRYELHTRMNPAEFNPTDGEKRALMMSIAERGKFGLSPDDCIEVAEYLTHSAKKSGKPLDMRLLDTALNKRKQYDNKVSETHWRDMVQSVVDGIIIEPKIKPRTRQARMVDERDIARQVYNSFPDDREARRKEWERMTGGKSE